MELDRLQVALRPRTPWEAMDLGICLGRTWIRPLWTAWCVAALPPIGLIWLALWDQPLLALFLTWWLKPVWDHAILHVLSRALFGGETGLLGALRGALAESWRDLPGKLVARRLAPWRTVVAPVGQLEGLRGAAARRRRAVLSRGLGTHCVWLVLLSVALEVTLALGLLGLLVVFLPDEPRFAFSHLSEQVLSGEAPPWVAATLPLTLVAAMTIVEPLIVAAGFGLYIHRRTLLEGWDVELVFRRLAARLRGIGAVVVVLAGLFCAAAGGPAWAEAPPAAPPPTDAEVRAAVDDVLAQPEFGSTEIQTRWELREGVPQWLKDLIAWLFDSKPEAEARAPNLTGIGLGLEVLLWTVGSLLTVALVVAVIRWRATAQRDPRGRARAHAAAIAGQEGLPAVPTPPPDDPPAQARRLWAAGRREEALALLYTASVGWLVEAQALAVPEGATEGEVLRLARRSIAPGPYAVFRRLTHAWQQVAYAHRALGAEQFEGLCAAWPELVGDPT